VLLEQPGQIGDLDPGETLVLQRHEELRFLRAAFPDLVGPALRQERRLPAASHADDGERLAADAGQADVAAGQRRGRDRQRLGQLQSEQVSGSCHFEDDIV
jgi:hypothetical protein